MKTILVLTDFSDNSRKAIQHTIKFLEEFEASYRLLILNTYLVPQNSDLDIISLNDKMRNESLAGLNEDLKFAQKEIDHHRVQIEIICRMGTFHNVISSIIKKDKVDLVVLGIDEKENILRSLSDHYCPVMFVPR